MSDADEMEKGLGRLAASTQPQEITAEGEYIYVEVPMPQEIPKPKPVYEPELVVYNGDEVVILDEPKPKKPPVSAPPIATPINTLTQIETVAESQLPVPIERATLPVVSVQEQPTNDINWTKWAIGGAITVGAGCFIWALYKTFFSEEEMKTEQAPKTEKTEKVDGIPKKIIKKRKNLAIGNPMEGHSSR
jgi:hypothetical protein